MTSTGEALAKLPASIAEAGKPHRWKPGESGNPAGRRNSTIKTADTAEAKAWAQPRVQRVLERLDKHLGACAASKDCGMCRHYNLIVLEYAYGKPPQRHELIQATLRTDTEALAKRMGLSDAETKEALAEVERHYTALKAAK